MQQRKYSDRGSVTLLQFSAPLKECKKMQQGKYSDRGSVTLPQIPSTVTE